jgi:meso-butanediol dehydrogenase / (S,S)-butanediol dehydrogenase / diacetyl reductase
VTREPPVPEGLPEITAGAPSARRFEGRVCLVTGAASGIGRAAVLRLAAEGASVIAADLDLAGARATLQLAGEATDALAIEVDVRAGASVETLARQVEKKFKELDVLVNNAGIEIQGDVLETEPEAWDEVFAVNLRGSFLTSRALLPLLLRRAAEAGRAAIVNNASLMGLVSSRRLAAYCAAKAGVVSLTRSMALDHAKTGLRVNCVCPGIVHTPMLERRFAQFPSRAEAWRATVARPPVKYIGRPEDVAAAIAYLASDEARFVTGAALTIDGGVGAA